ncbi:MAG: hypothetical protein C0600_02265 [Ignavibacteria bacterium]|nr:MAG: hypothetical protein C0600_02265 [Ignavibacteria bacterium]
MSEKQGSRNGSVILGIKHITKRLVADQHKHFSVEASYGWALQNDFDDWSYRASLGLNWHRDGNSSLTAGIAFSNAHFFRNAVIDFR